MFRFLLSGALALAVVAEAAAQSAPARTNTTAAPAPTTRKTSARPATKATTRSAAAQRSAAAGGRDDIGPGGNGAVGSTESADGKGQNAYAAPGMPVNVDNPKKVGGYNGPAPTRSKTPTTLTPR